MRVGIFTNTYPPTLNGVANCVEAYRQGLEARGHEVHVFAPCPRDFDPSDDPERVYRFPAVGMPGDWDYEIAVPLSKAVMSTLREVPFDLVHTQHSMWVGVWGAWYARRADLPLVTTVHTDYAIYAKFIPLPEHLVEGYLRGRVATYCNKCDLVTTPVPSARERLLAQGVTTPIELLPNPIDLSALPTPDGASVRAELGLGRGAFVMGFVGRLAPEKNLQTVLEAAASVMQQVARARFVLVGEGSDLKPLRAFVQDLGIADRVLFTGAVEHSRVLHYQAALDVFMTASMSETQPLSYTEAMAVGTPVVAVRAPGSQDMIEHGVNGLLSDPEAGPAGLAAQVLSLLKDPPRRAGIIAHAKNHVQRYALPAVADRLLEIYELATEGHQRAED